MAVQLDGQPVAVEPQAQTPPMPDFNFGSVDMMDVSAFDNPMAAIFGSHADATAAPAGTDTAGEGTGYIPRSFTELAGTSAAGVQAPQQSPPNPAPPVAATPPSPATTAPATPADPASTPAAPPQPDLDALRREVDDLKSVKEYMETQEFSNAKLVAEQLLADPVTFIQTYMPNVVQQLGIRQAVSDNVPPQDFARQYMESKLSEKYGEEFQYNPHDAGFKNTESYNYDLDRQLLIQEGFSTYYAAQQQQMAQAQQHQAQAINTAVKTGEAHGLSPDTVRQALAAMESDQTSDPVATYYDMLFTWMVAKGKITPQAGTPAAAAPATPPNPNTMQRRPESVPAPSAASMPAGSAEPLTAALQRMAEDFPLDYIMNGSSF